MARVSMIVRWRGRNGYGSSVTPTATARSVAQTVLVMNKLATRSMLAVTRRPSATTPGSVANRLSSSTSSATALVAAAPEPMAMPMSASLRASTSLTPSPVIATVCPRACRAVTIACFCCGVTRPKTERSSSRRPSAPGSSGRSRASTGSVGVGQARPRRDGADGERAVPGDHLQRHALRREVRDGLGRRRIAAARRAGRRPPPAGPAGATRRPAGPAARASTRTRRPLAARPGGLRQLFLLAAGQHHLRRSQHPGAVPGEAGRAPLARGGERHGVPAAPTPAAAGTPARWRPASRCGSRRRPARRAPPRPAPGHRAGSGCRTRWSRR